MQVFMDLALKMCEASERVSSTGLVDFDSFVDYFSQGPSLAEQPSSIGQINSFLLT